MAKYKLFGTLKSFWQAHLPRLIFVLLILFFWVSAVFVAVNLKEDIIPDEPYHFSVSEHFAGTWGVPADVPVARAQGTNLSRVPNLGYWLYGRGLNIIDLFRPEASMGQRLVSLRILNSFFSVGTIVV